MPTITPTLTVGQIVAANPETGVVFERLGIDYCCGGHRSLGEACALAKINGPDKLRGVRDALDMALADVAAYSHELALRSLKGR